jgi:ParB family transcriptional regulator, chromosome partitioning protein
VGLLERSQDELLDILAFIAGVSVSLLRVGVGATAHEGPIASALSFNMRSWFVPRADNYFGRVSRMRILAAIDEATGSHAPALEKLKKAELANRAAQLVSETTWLPEPLRTTPKAA